MNRTMNLKPTLLVTGDEVEVKSKYNSGDIVLFHILMDKKEGKKRKSISTILKRNIIINERNVVQATYITENGKTIRNKDIVELIRKKV